MEAIAIVLVLVAACLALAGGIVAVRAQRRARRYGTALDEAQRQLRPISERIHGVVERTRAGAEESAGPDPKLEELLARIAEDGSAVVALRQLSDEVSPGSRSRRRPGPHANRSDYEAELEREIARARRTGRPLSLVLLDVEQATPDRVLQLAALLTRVPRVTDTVCRRRRDAFGILLPETAEDGALRFRERLNEELAELGSSRRTTFAAGIVQWRPNESGESLDARARAALEGDAAGPGGIAADLPA